MITAGGVGSGLDVEGLIRQLMTIERQPLQALEKKKSDYNARISALGKLNSAVADFQTAIGKLKSTTDFEVFSTTSSDKSVLTATANSNAAVGTFNILVQQLATAHKLGSAAVADTGTTTFGNAGDTLTITVNGKSFTVASGGKTLAAIRDAINNATDNVGVKASIISESASSHRLILTSDSTGTANTITTAFKDSAGNTVADPLSLATIAAAQDAKIQVDGTYTIVRGSNSISDAISGVTLNLQAVSTTPVTLAIGRDTGTVKKNVQAFIDAYNSLHSTLESLRTGQLEGDSTVRSIESRIRNILNTAPSGLTSSYQYLSQVGVSLNKDGVMTLDGTRFDKAIAADFHGVAQVFANDSQGYLFRLDSAMTQILDPKGVIESRKDGLGKRIKLVDTRISNMEYRLQLIEKRYRRQFSALDALLGQMKATSNFLAQRLGG